MKINRRNFIKSSALFGSIMILPSLATSKIKGANGRMRAAVVGWEAKEGQR
ncbi:MAG: hypothetical protein ACLUKN_07020 [Bacilli bacterium]